MSTSSVIGWDTAEIRVSGDGVRSELVLDRQLVVTLSWAQCEGGPAETELPDEVEHTLSIPAGRLLQRHSGLEHWRARWVLDVGSQIGLLDAPPLFQVQPGPEWSLWSWGSGATGLLVVVPKHQPGPILGLRLESGYLAEAGDPDWHANQAQYRITPSRSPLRAGQRVVTSLQAAWYPDLVSLEARLPGWLSETQLDADEDWWADLADFGVTVPEDVQISFEMGLVGLRARAGRRVIQIDTPRGLSRVGVEWVPSISEVLAKVAGMALALPGELPLAAAFCVQTASDRHLLWLSDADQMRLDQVDWAGDPTLLGAGFGILRGRALGEAGLIGDALRVLGRIPVSVGYPRAVMAAWLASVTVGLDAQELCLELLGRRAVGRTAALESALLQYRGIEAGTDGLTSVANQLGGMLPGEAPLLTWKEQASLVGLLGLCPAEWPGATWFSQVAEKAKGQVLCAYWDERIIDSEPLAMLLLTPELSLAG